MEKKEIGHVQYFLIRGDRQDLCQSDLVLLDGARVVVLEWDDHTNKQKPLVYIPIDLEHLKAPTEADGLFHYSVPLVDPRIPKSG